MISPLFVFFDWRMRLKLASNTENTFAVKIMRK